MRYLIGGLAIALLGVGATATAAPLCCCCRPDERVVPRPCGDNLPLCAPEHTQAVLRGLGCCAGHTDAVCKLGVRVRSGIGDRPPQFAALIDVLLFDPSWEARQAAVWGLSGQHTACTTGLLALCIAAKSDPDPGVRARACDSFLRLTSGRQPCRCCLFRRAEVLLTDLKAWHYVPCAANARQLFALVQSGCQPPVPAGLAGTTVATAEPPIVRAPARALSWPAQKRALVRPPVLATQPAAPAPPPRPVASPPVYAILPPIGPMMTAPIPPKPGPVLLPPVGEGEPRRPVVLPPIVEPPADRLGPSPLKRSRELPQVLPPIGAAPARPIVLPIIRNGRAEPATSGKAATPMPIGPVLLPPISEERGRGGPRLSIAPSPLPAETRAAARTLTPPPLGGTSSPPSQALLPVLGTASPESVKRLALPPPPIRPVGGWGVPSSW